MAYPTTWIFDVAFSSWDEVDVTVENGLPSCRSGIYSDIKALNGLVLCLYQIAELVEHLISGQNFLASKTEIIPYMPFGYDQSM